MAESTPSTLPLPSNSLPARPPSAESKPLSTEDSTSMSGAIQADSEAPATNDEASKPPAESDIATANGDAPTTETTEDKPTEPPAADTEDTEMKDQDESGAAAPPSSDPVEPEANGTPASTSKRPQNAKRKSTGGVPEHKGGKKLNKKKSKAMMTHLDAQPGEYYFARLKSYPPWPSIICDERMLPQSLLTTRPVTTKQIDGTYREMYADGGKRVYERTFPIMFLHTNEFAWIPNTDLTPLNLEDVTNFSEKSKTKALIQAFKVAAEQHELGHFKEMLQDHMRAMQEDQEAREARAAEKAAKASKKGKRKSTDAADEDEDVAMDDAEEEEGESKPKGSKKRKKDADSDGETEKPAKTPKTATKLKLSTPKTPATTEGKKKESKAKPKAASAKKAGKASGSDEGDAETPKEPEKPLDPQEQQQKKEKEVLYLRHKLQKGLLTRDQVPKEEEMSSMSDFIQKLERYPDLEVSTIRTTKINKVLKAIIKLPTIPKDEEYHIRSRSVDLLGKWNILLSSSEAGPSTDAADKDEPTTNGVHKDDGEDASEKADGPADVEMNEKPAEKPEVSPPAEQTEPEVEKPKDDVEMNEALKEAEAPAPAAVPEEKPAEEKNETLEGETSEAPVTTVQPAAEATLEATA